MTLSWKTRLIQPQVSAPEGFRSLATPVYRGSTTLLPGAAEVTDHWDQRRTRYSYGFYGTPTSFELAARLAELEGGYHTFLTPGGQAAISLIFLSIARSGGHVLVPDNAYGPTKDLADRVLARLGIEVERYDPMIGGRIASLFRPNTQLVWCESPGSVTMEIQDVPALAAAARERGIPLALDNTYASGVLFDAFKHGVDISMQALTKYVGGHSDILLGSVTLRDSRFYDAVGDAHQLLGFAVSPDDCSLALRGMQTLAVRLKELEAGGLAVARWLANRQDVKAVLHPAFPACPGHLEWKRDFSGASSVFSVVFRPEVPRDRLVERIDRLKLFKLGYSWGGVTSLVMPFFDLSRQHAVHAGWVVRFHVGLEDPADLLADLEQAFPP